QSDDAEDKNEHGRESDGDGDDDEIDGESDHPARQNALEQLRVGSRVVGVGFDVDRHATEMEKKSGLRKGLRGHRGARLERAACLRHCGAGRKCVAITLADIEAARRVIKGAVLRTPMLPAPRLSALTGAEVYVKYENLQVTNSFKDRGALVKLTSLNEAERKLGVIAMSAGNHAQAVAYHAARLKIPATIVMPVTTPFVKVAATKSHGAEVVLYGESV